MYIRLSHPGRVQVAMLHYDTQIQFINIYGPNHISERVFGDILKRSFVLENWSTGKDFNMLECVKVGKGGVHRTILVACRNEIW